MLNLKDKVINNSRHIRIPLHGGPSISEFPCLTVICKKNPNITVEVEKENQRAMEVASIFKGMAKIIEVERESKDWDDTVDCYPKTNPFAHMSEIFLDMSAMESDDLIPYILLTDEELQRAFEFTSKLEKPPLFINAFTGGYKNKCPLAAIKMLDFEKWEEILYVLKNKYTILSTGFKENHYNLKYTTPVYDLKIREIAALMRACGKCIMVESGMFHLGVASGAFCFGIIPGYGYIAADANNGTLSSNYIYEDTFWKHETKRVKYILKHNYKDILKYL